MTAYETISQRLREGKYKAGDRLLEENILVEQLQVSRDILRQAVLLPQEDGLIINHQGKGNTVFSNQDTSKGGLGKVGNPTVGFCIQPVDRVVTSVGFQPATQKHQQVLRLWPSDVVAVTDIIYYCGETSAGFAMVYMPYEILDSSDVDLEDTDTVYRHYTEFLSSNGLHSDTEIHLERARERLANILCIQKGDPLLLLEGVLYTEHDTPVSPQKLFFGPDQHGPSIRRKNDKNTIKGLE